LGVLASGDGAGEPSDDDDVEAVSKLTVRAVTSDGCVRALCAKISASRFRESIADGDDGGCMGDFGDGVRGGIMVSGGRGSASLVSFISPCAPTCRSVKELEEDVMGVGFPIGERGEWGDWGGVAPFGEGAGDGAFRFDSGVGTESEVGENFLGEVREERRTNSTSTSNGAFPSTVESVEPYVVCGLTTISSNSSSLLMLA
jgi:hypothetical protein